MLVNNDILNTVFIESPYRRLEFLDLGIFLISILNKICNNNLIVKQIRFI